MSRPVVVLDEAEHEITSAEAWYEQQRPGLGVEFRLGIDDAVRRLAEAPQSAPPLLSVPDSIGARSVHVKRFPHSVVFIEQDEALWVVAVAHQHRRPGYWLDRPSP